MARGEKSPGHPSIETERKQPKGEENSQASECSGRQVGDDVSGEGAIPAHSAPAGQPQILLPLPEAGLHL